MIKLVTHRSSFVHPECLDALHKLNARGKEAGWKKLQVEGCSFGSHQFTPLSALYTGREFHIQIDAPIESLWSVAIPLGFIPWNRYPVQDDNAHIFHYYGKWAPLIDFLHSEGMGEWAWSSFCCASLLEIGSWEGDKPIERAIQMHLHRLGIHCGPIDGIIGERTLQSLKTLGLSELRNQEILEKIQNWDFPEPVVKKQGLGHLHLGSHDAKVFTSGGVKAIQSHNGYTISIQGSGRIIVFVE